jgi:hypothetical protein
VRKISPAPGFDSRIVQLLASPCADYYPGPQNFAALSNKIITESWLVAVAVAVGSGATAPDSTVQGVEKLRIF